MCVCVCVCVCVRLCPCLYECSKYYFLFHKFFLILR